jgi:hypothetical protein
VWPYSIIGDTSPLFSLAKRTFAHRPNTSAVDWSFDPIQAARLGLGSEVGSTLIASTQKFQGFANGMAIAWMRLPRSRGRADGVVAAALRKHWSRTRWPHPRGSSHSTRWDFDGAPRSVAALADVQTRNEEVTTLVIESVTTSRSDCNQGGDRLMCFR